MEDMEVAGGEWGALAPSEAFCAVEDFSSVFCDKSPGSIPVSRHEPPAPVPKELKHKGGGGGCGEWGIAITGEEAFDKAAVIGVTDGPSPKSMNWSTGPARQGA